MHHQVEARPERGGVALHCPVCGKSSRAAGETWVEDMNDFVISHAHGLEGLGGITDATP